MIKQTLFFSTPVMLSLKNQQMVISFKDSEDKVTRPIEDIGFVILENPMISITMPLLNELVKNNVSVILCDDRRMPNSMLMSLDSNYTQGESLKFQIEISEPIKKQVWKQIVESKIRNQALLLNKIHKCGDLLKPYYMNVKSGDIDNREGLAARIYWNNLLGKEFFRDRNGAPPNDFLNYGYSILRAATARALLGSGLMPSFGVFHRNRYNAFPLADDIMEPYRPYVDDLVYGIYINKGMKELNKETKAELLRLLFSDVNIGKVTRPLEIALTITTASLSRFYKGETKKMALPIIQ